MSRSGSSGGGRSSLGYLFEPEEIYPIHRFKSNRETEKPPEGNILLPPQDDKVMTCDEADQQEAPYEAPPKREEDSNPIVSHRPASIIYHTNQSGNNSGLLITDRPSTRVRRAWRGVLAWISLLFGDERS